MKLVIFDYNGVLVDDLKLHARAFLEIGRRHGSKMTEKGLWAIMSKPTREKIAAMFPGKTEEEIDELLSEKEDAYIRLAKKSIHFEGTDKVIKSLAAEYKLAIISNTTRRQLFAVFPKELLNLFGTIVTYEEITKPKPAPDSLLLVMGRLDAMPEDSCYIGDAESDMKAARAAGVKAIGLPGAAGSNTKEELLSAGADIVINSLEDIGRALQSI